MILDTRTFTFLVYQNVAVQRSCYIVTIFIHDVVADDSIDQKTSDEKKYDHADNVF